MSDHPEYRINMTASVASSTLEYVDRQTKLLQRTHPKGRPFVPKRGNALDRIVDHAKKTGFKPV